MQKVICFFRENLLYTLLFLFFIPFVVVLFYHITGVSVGQLYTFGIPDLKDFYTFWIATFGVIGVAYNISLNQKRITHQEKQISQQNEQLDKQQEQIELQSKVQRDNRFAKGLELLGSVSESTRIGAIHTLYFLAKEFQEEYRKTVFEILCSHVRTQTTTDGYKKNYENKPSNEIQTILNLLSKKKDGCFLFEDLKADLNHTYLAKVNLRNANLQGANLMRANLMRVKLREAILTKATLTKANLTRADLREAKLVGAKLSRADLMGADLTNAYLFEANLTDVEYDDRTIFTDAIFTNTILSDDLKEKLGL